MFDVLEVDGDDLTKLPLEQRKERLAKLVGRDSKGVIRYSDHVIGNGTELRSECMTVTVK